MKTIKTLACPRMFWYTLQVPAVPVVMGVILFIFTKQIAVFAPMLGFALVIWFILFFKLGNAYSVSVISSSGISNGHLKIKWEKADKFIVTTSWANYHLRRNFFIRPIRTICIYFGKFNEKGIRRQDIRECVILPTSKKVLNAIKFYRPDIYEKIISDIQLEKNFKSTWDARLYD